MLIPDTFNMRDLANATEARINRLYAKFGNVNPKLIDNSRKLYYKLVAKALEDEGKICYKDPMFKEYT